MLHNAKRNDVMKKIITAMLALALVACPFTQAFAKTPDSVPTGKTGGVIISQGASGENYLNKTAGANSALPSRYSSVDMCYVTPVKDQKTQNTCIFFSATAAMETSLLKNGYGEYDLSEEYANYWASKRKDGTGWQRDRVEIGAFPYTGYGYLTTGGVVAESTLPYMSRTEEYFEDLEPMNPLFYAGGIKLLSGPDLNAVDYKKTIMEAGGVVSSFALIDEYLNTSTNAFYCGDELTEEQLSANGHSVFVVGWDDNYSKENFKSGAKPQNDGAWIIKNSWGEYYSYIYVSYEDKYLGAEIFGGNYAINDIIKNHTCNELLSVDSYGPIYNMSFYGNDDTEITDATFINTFNFTKEMPSISSVEFSTEALGADYKIYYIPTENGIPVDDEALWIKLADGQIEYKGIQNIAVDSYIVPKSDGAIGVKITSSDGTPATIGCCEWYGDYENNNFLFLPKTIDNRSFVQLGNYNISLTDFYGMVGDSIGGNFTIRAVANVIKGDIEHDGSLSINDATTLQQHLAEMITLDSDTLSYVADVNSDGVVAIDDATEIQSIIAGIV